MNWKEIFKIKKIILTVVLVSYLWNSRTWAEMSSITNFLMYGLLTEEIINLRSIIIFILELMYHIIISYILICLTIIGYDKIMLKYPNLYKKIGKFFELTIEKELIIFILFILAVCVGMISTIVLTEFPFARGIGIILQGIAMILWVDDVHPIFRWYRGYQYGFVDELFRLIIPLIWWYLIASIIMWIKNRKKTR